MNEREIRRRPRDRLRYSSCWRLFDLTLEACFASTISESAQTANHQGVVGIRLIGVDELAEAEQLFWSCCQKIQGTLRRLKFVPEELQNLEHELRAIYYCNFSVFQSAPDSWAIDQLFPIMPISLK